jgi:hypothetical protein
MRKLLLAATELLLSAFSANKPFAAVVDAAPESLPKCTTAAPGSGVFCRKTPDKYEVKLYELGLCKAHPFGKVGASTNATMNKTSCVKIWDNTSGYTVDVAQLIGGVGASEAALVGTAYAPPEGTYTHPYVIMDTSVAVKGSHLHSDGNTYYSTSTGSTSTVVGNFADHAYRMDNFGDSTKCFSGFIDSPGSTGKIDAFFINNSLTRPDETDKTAIGGVDRCTHASIPKLVGIINLDDPFIITPRTSSIKFTFFITDYGLRVQYNAGAPNWIGLGPFVGKFEAINVD